MTLYVTCIVGQVQYLVPAESKTVYWVNLWLEGEGVPFVFQSEGRRDLLSDMKRE